MCMCNFAWKVCPWNDLYCVGRDVKPYSLAYLLCVRSGRWEHTLRWQRLSVTSALFMLWPYLILHQAPRSLVLPTTAHSGYILHNSPLYQYSLRLVRFSNQKTFVQCCMSEAGERHTWWVHVVKFQATVLHIWMMLQLSMWLFEMGLGRQLHIYTNWIEFYLKYILAHCGHVYCVPITYTACVVQL